jgi:hypothetical protein
VGVEPHRREPRLQLRVEGVRPCRDAALPDPLLEAERLRERPAMF